jgi:hypothetical protein
METEATQRVFALWRQTLKPTTEPELIALFQSLKTAEGFRDEYNRLATMLVRYFVEERIVFA